MHLSKRPILRSLAVLAALSAAAILPSAAMADTTGCGNTVIRGYDLPGSGSSFTRSSADTFTYPSTDVPKATVDGSTVASTVAVTATGKVRSVKVTIGNLVHPADQELKLTLQAPDGTRVVLADGLGGTGANYSGTVFKIGAPSVLTGSAPFASAFTPQGDFTRFVDRDMAGTWRLEVSDLAGGSTGALTSWTLEVTRKPCGAHPTASFIATPNPVSPGGTASFDASASTGANNSAIVQYEWDLDGNGTYETNTGAVPTTTHPYPTKGVVAVGLRVTDINAATDETVVPLPVTLAPTASFTLSPVAPLSLSPVTLDGSASTDPDGTVVRYEWDLDGNGTYETESVPANNPILTTQFATSGIRDVHLRVTDDLGATSISSITVNVQNQPPLASFNVQNPPAIVGAPTTLDAATSSDPDGTIAHYEWDLDDNGSYETDGSTQKTIQYTVPSSGTYFVSLRVTDNSGVSSTIRKSFIATQAPVPAASASVTEVRPNVPVTFDSAGSADPDGSVVLYEWDFDGDGTVDSSSTTSTPVSHSYPAVGTYNATLIITDDKGAKAVKVIVISVVNKLPIGALTVNPTPGKTGEVVTFDSAGSFDPDGTIVRHEWDLDGNGTFETDTGATAVAARAFPNRLRLTVKVRVTDNDGATATASAPLAVDGPTVTTPAPGSGGSKGGKGGSTSLTFQASLLGASIQKIKTALKKGLGVACQVDRKATCKIEVVVMPKDVKRLKLAKGKKAKKAFRIATAKGSTKASGKKSFKIKLSKKAKKALKKTKKLVVVVRGTATDASGTKVSLKRAVLLRK